ncbi:MAG: shikimate kinase [Erysipelotrichales bacterium]|nr:shikimate kinase [Erysipelotrichales bacterium]
MLIYIIGMPLSGKTTFGKELAEALGFNFFDTDAEIEKNASMFIDEIFKDFGENKFRELETEVLHNLSKEKNAVIATGGGIITNQKNELYLNTGFVIYLKSEIALLETRNKASIKVRPLLALRSLEELFKARKDKYLALADLVIDNSVNNNEIIAKILSTIGDNQ